MKLKCPHCSATAEDNATERGRFRRRHGAHCKKAARKEFAKQLAQGTRSTESTTWEEHQAEREDRS